MVELLRDAFRTLTDVEGLIRWGGTALVCLIVFVETGLFVGFFLPGDSLLVTAGVFAAAGHLDLAALLGLVSLCAFVGDQLGYLIGHHAGEALYRRDDSFLFKKKHLQRAHDFYEKYGGKTVILARYVPIVRTFAPAVAGAAAMRYRRYVTYSMIGGPLWVGSMVLTGYFLGSAVPDINQNIHLVIVAVVFVSFLPAIFEVLRHRWRKPPAVVPEEKELRPS
jgi:membrane-associated protein